MSPLNLYYLYPLGTRSEQISDKDIQDVTRKVGLNYSELENLYYALGLQHDSIEKAKQSAITMEPRLQANRVLQTWRRMNGNAATKQAIIDALMECHYREAVENLQDEWNLKPEGTSKPVGMFLRLLLGLNASLHKKRGFQYY